MVHLAEVQRPPLPKWKKKEPLVFTDEDYPPVLSPHREALVVKVEINNVVVHRTLVDTGSSVNIMYNNTFKELGLSRNDLKPIHTPLSGFTGDTIEAEGTITVRAGVGDGTHRLWLDVEFMVAQLDCAHHLILGRLGLEDLECVISPVHLCMKFNTPTGVGVAKGIRKEEGRPRAEPAEEVEEVTLDPAKPEQKGKVGKTLPHRSNEQLLEVLRAFKVLFAWGPEDMPGVDPKIICHRLAVDPTHKPVKQKKRFLSSERREFVTKQVTTLQSIGHIREAHPVHVLSQIPIGTLLWSLNAPSRVSKWGVFLGSFLIEFKPRPAIKGQALADFVVECIAREVESNREEPEGNWWIIYIDGPSATDASGGGVVEISPEGFKAYYSVRFRFKVQCDSKLIVGHVTGEFEAKDERMKRYRDTPLELLKAFGAYRIEQVPREENAEADILSKLGPDSPDHMRLAVLQGAVLQGFGFTEKSTSLLLQNLRSTYISVLVNGKPSGFFQIKRGVKQEDPLSPLFFILGSEGFSRSLEHAINIGYIAPYKAGRSMVVSHLDFADDLIVFLKGDFRNLLRFKHILNNYLRALGQEVNQKKSTIYCKKNFHGDYILKVEEALGYRIDNPPFKYLGSTITTVQDLPKSIINLIHSKLANFFWGTKNGKYKHHWAKWTTLYKPTGEGGIGTRSLFDIQKASALKLWWKSVTEQSIWASFMRDRYYRDGLFEAKLYDSSSRKKICRISHIGLRNTTLSNHTYSWINGEFTFKEAYWAVRERNISEQLFTLNWNKFQIPKVKLFSLGKL
ncbi:unnamed protein product [Cuscuta campestris]|uniref:Reverse transcriptase domain-containing protein n=1 Tax=Cuscuta campestris TaxID=132261 RepID=A0A484LIE9_9ASTE|nr:unnamed protein product [Cuscuta campestris]